MRLATIIWATVGLATLSAAVVWRLGIKAAADAELAKGQAARKGSAPRVVLATAVEKDIVQSVEAVGSLVSPYVVRLSPRVAGQIAFLQAREGDVVMPGQVLVKIDPSDLRGQVLQQEASVAEAKSRLAQAQLGQGAANTSVTASIDQQQAGLGSARADLAQAQQSYQAQIAGAQAQVEDVRAKIGQAEANVRSAEADVNSAQANRENGQSRYDRVKGLFDQGFIAAQDVDDARSGLKVLQSNVEAAQAKLRASASALRSAQAQLVSAQAQARIVTEKGKSDVTAAQARLAQTKAGLSVARANRSQSPAYQQNIAALAASVAVAEAQLSQVRSKLADTELRSSIAGVVTARQADEGSLASPGQPLLTVQYLKWLHVTASLPIEQSALVRLGVRVIITVDALPGETFEAPVVEVNPSADDASRQFTIRLKLDNAKGTLKPGMFVHLKIITGKVRGATVVPRDAVKTTDEGSTVTLVDKEMVAHVTPVTLGAAETDALQITQGVQPGDRVVILAYQPVKDAQKVREGDAKKPKGKAKP